MERRNYRNSSQPMHFSVVDRLPLNETGESVCCSSLAGGIVVLDLLQDV
jgi:hypothetical protein